MTSFSSNNIRIHEHTQTQSHNTQKEEEKPLLLQNKKHSLNTKHILGNYRRCFATAKRKHLSYDVYV